MMSASAHRTCCVRQTVLMAGLFLFSSGLVSAQTETTVRMLRVDGTQTKASGVVSFENDTIAIAPESIRLTDLVRIDFESEVRPSGTIVFLSNGDQVPLAVEQIADDALSGQYEDQKLGIPLEYVHSIAFQLPESRSARSDRLTAIASDRAEDTITLENGDQIRGELQSMALESLSIQTAAGSRKIPRQVVTSIQFAAELQAPVPGEGQSAIVRTTDGFILTVRELKSATENTILRTLAGPTIRIPTAQLHSIQLLHNRIVYLSDLKPESTKHIPYLGSKREWKANRNVDGGNLQHNGRRYDRGIGTSSRSEITYRLNGKYKVFHTAFGLDDTAKTGAALFRIRLDNKSVFASNVVRSADDILRTPALDVSKARKLTLIVDFGPRGDVQDVANWLDPVLVAPR